MSRHSVSRWLIRIVLVGAVIGVAGLWFTRPQQLPPNALAGLTADVENGAVVFTAAGCASCHKAPESEDTHVLAGGLAFSTPFGVFYAPNISMDEEHGIGAWSDLDIASAIVKGTSPDSRHYYPAFPYSSYLRSDLQDIADLVAYLRTLPADPTPSRAHDVGFPFNIRASLGGWKLLFLRPEWVVTGDLTEQQVRGRTLVESIGHCGECHTPRNALGGLDYSRWLGGAANPSGEGRIPDIRPGTLGWSEVDIVYYLTTGFTPDFDSAGGEMVDVIANTSQLPISDVEAIAAYLQIVQSE